MFSIIILKTVTPNFIQYSLIFKAYINGDLKTDKEASKQIKKQLSFAS